MENGGPENAGPTTGMENAGTNNYAEYMYIVQSLVNAEGGFRRLVPTFSVYRQKRP